MLDLTDLSDLRSLLSVRAVIITDYYSVLVDFP